MTTVIGTLTAMATRKADRLPRGRRRLVSLLEMLEFNARHFIVINRLLGQTETMFASIRDRLDGFDLQQNPVYHQLIDSMNSQFLDSNVSLMNELRAVCESLGLDAAIAQIQRFSDMVPVTGNTSVSDVAAVLKDLRLRIEDQLKSRTFFVVAHDRAKYYSDKALFGLDVDSKFPETIFDIEEAGKCLSLSRATATVCHLMRVVEVGVKRLATKLSATIDTNKPWGWILNIVDAEIEKLKKTGTDVAELEGIAASLHAVKDAWRDPAMHSKTKYTEEEAEEIFSASRTFMRRLAKVI
jgi:adenine C2-methylase RlmN of 23S rRNA A2503 and tRNA A37